jgi:multidrug efflux pump subunit AcrB
VKDKEVAESAGDPMSTSPHRAIDVDRDLCAQRGVELNELFTTLQMSLGGVHATDLHKFGRAFKVTVQTDPRFARQIDDLSELAVKNDKGEMVVLGALIKIRKTSAPMAIVRVNGYRAIIITAASASGRTPADVAAKCVKLAQEVLPRGYRMMDLTGESQ